MSRQKRPTDTYVKAAQELAQYFPNLKKYRRRKTLKPSEKGAIARKERLFVAAHADHLIPVDKATARLMKDKLFTYEETHTIKRGPNKGKQITRTHTFQGIQLRNTGKDVEFKRFGKDIFVTSNGRLWAYWELPSKRPKSLQTAAQEAFEIEMAIELARKAFRNPQTKGVFLWAQSGRVGEGFQTLEEFTQWIWSDYSKYKNTERWVKGIAFLIADVNERIPLSEWAKFGTKPKRKPRRGKRRTR